MVAKADGTEIQKNHYYQFGMEFAENSGDSDQPYKYNGKELDKMHGLNMYDYSARYYEPAIGRFTTVDPLAEKYYSWSPYSFVLGNPIRNIDPLGMDVWTTNDPAEIERVLSSLKSGETVDSNKFGDQWTRVENVSENDYAIFDDQTSDFTIGGVPYKDFTGYGKKGVGFDLLIDLMGLGLTKKGGTLTLFIQQSMDKNKFIRASYYSIVYSGQAMSNKISLSKTRLNLGSLGKGLGYLGGVSLGVTTVNDIYGVYTNTITPERAVFNFSMGGTALMNPAFGIPYALTEAFVPGGMETVIGAGALVRQEHKKALGDIYDKWWFPKEQFPIP